MCYVFNNSHWRHHFGSDCWNNAPIFFIWMFWVTPTAFILCVCKSIRVSVLLHCGLVDLGFRGNLFTWNNGREKDDYVQERLDRACATTKWRDKLSHSHVTHLQAAYFDHIPILITTQSQRQTRKKKIPQRFEERWATHPDYGNVIQMAWEAKVTPSSPMARLFEKIKKCRFALLGLWGL